MTEHDKLAADSIRLAADIQTWCGASQPEDIRLAQAAAAIAARVEALGKQSEAAVVAMDAEVQKIEADERFHYPTATTDENAALALIQLEMKVRRGTILRYRRLIAEEGKK